MKDKEEMSNKERRMVSRIPSLNFVTYKYLDSDGNSEVEQMGRTIDISLGGIKLEVPQSYLPLDQVSLSIALEEAVISVAGEVAYRDKTQQGMYEVGIRFVDISPGDQAVVEKFLRDIVKQNASESS